jgi:hypothetical protein
MQVIIGTLLVTGLFAEPGSDKLTPVAMNICSA